MNGGRLIPVHIRTGRAGGSSRWIGSRGDSEFLVQTDTQTARQNLHGQRNLSTMHTPVAYPGAKRPTGDHIGLPVRLLLQAPDSVVERQQLQRPDPIVPARALVEYERRHEGGLQRDLATRKALAATALEPFSGPLVLIGSRATEAVFQNLRRDGGYRSRVNRLPE